MAAVAALIAGGLVSTSPAEAATTQLKVGQKAHFHYFDVTVEKAVMEPEYYGYLIKLKVCVNHLPPGSTGGKTRMSGSLDDQHQPRHPPPVGAGGSAGAHVPPRLSERGPVRGR